MRINRYEIFNGPYILFSMSGVSLVTGLNHTLNDRTPYTLTGTRVATYHVESEMSENMQDARRPISGSVESVIMTA
jgi:hypothetical protein